MNTIADDLTPNDGTVSLREAITAINAGNNLGDPDITAQSPGTFGVNDTINFNISGTFTIYVGSTGNGALPAITKPVTINGYSEPGAATNTLANGDNAAIKIELNGENAGPNADGLLVAAGGGGSTIEGLAINEFSLNGIELQSGGNVVGGNFIGVNTFGDAQEPNGNDGIRISNGSTNTIGGSTPAARNVVSGNTIAGIHIVGSLGSPATGNLIEGNFVGVSATGTGSVGLRPNTQFPGTVSGNFFAGIEISGGNANTVGGSSAGVRNVVGFNLEGIELDNGAQNNTIAGNFCGVGSDGLTATGNQLHGIVLRSDDNLSPPAGPGQPNEPAVSGNTIGGTAAGSGNVVEFNAAAGVAVFGNPLANNATPLPNAGNAILGNSIFQNGRSNPGSNVGIDLSNGFLYPKDDGPTPNDLKGHGAANDPNNFQNFPLLTSVELPAGGGTNVFGTLSMATLPGTQFRLEFFSSAPDPLGGIPEGQTFLGFMNVTSDGSGFVSFAASLSGTATDVHSVTATATDPSNNTSEFSAVIAVRGDFQGDGKSDVLWRNVATGDDSIWFMNGPVVGSSQGVTTVSNTNWMVAGIGDFNGDGKADILWRNMVTGDNALWLMNGAAVAVSVSLPSVLDTNWKIAGVGDFNGDGKADILWRNSSTGDNALWLMSGINVAVSASLPTVANTNWNVAGVGDFNGDGKADILWRDSSTGDNALWLMSGINVAVSASLPTVSDTNWKVAGVGDFNGDDMADILWRNSATGSNSVWLMSGINVAVSAALPTVADTNWKVARIGDFNGDGKADILWHDTLTGGNSVWLMSGINVAVSAALPTVVDTNWQVAGPP